MAPAPTVVLTNDDGIDAPGIAALHDALEAVASVTVVAPAEDHSGAGRRADREFHVHDHPRGYAVTGTPADCVAYGLHVVDDPDFVVAGANDGPNVGADNVGRSATVGGAAEAAFLGHAGLAISTYHPDEGRVPDPTRADFAAAGDLARHLVETVAPETLVEHDAYLSANVPTHVDADTRLHLTEPVHDYGLRVEPSGDGYDVTSAFYDPLRPDRDEPVTDPVGTDRRALADGDVSVAPLAATTNTVAHEHFDELEGSY
jgi:5'-nucleotidase